MNMHRVAEVLNKEKIPYALLDESDSEIRVLISEGHRELVRKTAAKAGWKKVKDRSGDLYLYGMKRFLYFLMGDKTLIICCQLACRSTLNDGWVPLDRKINGQALSNVINRDSICYLGTEDEMCYLLAKCVYTDRKFLTEDVNRIESCMLNVDYEKLLPKLKSIFFRFSDNMMQLLRERKYDDIIASLWCFAAY